MQKTFSVIDRTHGKGYTDLYQHVLLRDLVFALYEKENVDG